MLTDLSIKKLALPDKRREEPDGRITGLYLVVQPSGAKSWAVRYRFDGAPRKLTLGPYPAVDLATARRRAQEALGDLAGGRDPAAVKQATRAAAKAGREAETHVVRRVADSFVERYVKRNVGEAWGREIERLLKIEILPKLGEKQFPNMKKSDIHDLLDAIVDRGSPITANRTHAVLRQICRWAVERGIVVTSPCDGIKAPIVEKSRDRVLSDEEIRIAWRAFETVGWPFGRIAQLLLLTGARRDEIAAGRWSEVDHVTKTWSIAKERSKNSVAHEIPLSDAAVKIASALLRTSSKSDALVFSTTGKTPVSGFSKAKVAIDAAVFQVAKKDAEERGEDPEKIKGPDHWTLHDLRRTAASGMAGLGIAPHVVEAVLNHKSGTIKGVAAVYNRYSYATEKRAALDAWARKLEAVVTGREAGNVVELVAARR
jgi:integrase